VNIWLKNWKRSPVARANIPLDAELIQFGRSFLSKPVIQQGQIFQLKIDRQVEKVRMNLTSAASRSAMTKPRGRAIAVDAIVVRDLLSLSQVSQNDNQSPATDSLHIAIGIA
jgi:hypothetical protein